MAYVHSQQSGRGELMLPDGWDRGRAAPDGKMYYIDHKNQLTTWIHPRDKETKPLSFADCKDNELPFGWEQAYHPDFGVYYIDHNRCVNQIEDPCQLWRKEQERLLAEYVQEARERLLEKQDMLTVKQLRLALAQDDFHAYSARLQECDRRQSMGFPVRHDAVKLHQELKACKQKIAYLKVELERTKAEVEFQHEGMKTLEHVERKMSNRDSYRLEDAEVILTEVNDIQHALQASEVKKAKLMMALATLSDDLSLKATGRKKAAGRRKATESNKKISVDSYEGLSWRKPQYGAMGVEKRAIKSPLLVSPCHKPSIKEQEYEKIQLRVLELENRLADLDRVVSCGRDRDKMLLLREKEELLVELKRVDPSAKTEEERKRLQHERKRLEDDLRSSQHISQRIMEERLALQEEKSALLLQLTEANKSAAQLEVQLLSEQSRALARADLLTQEDSRHSLFSDISNISSDPFFHAVHSTSSEANGDQPFQSLYQRVTKKRPHQMSASHQSQTKDTLWPSSQPLPHIITSGAACGVRSASQQTLPSGMTDTVEQLRRRGYKDRMVQTDDEESIANASMFHESSRVFRPANIQGIQTSTEIPLLDTTRKSTLEKTSIGLESMVGAEDGQMKEAKTTELAVETSPTYSEVLRSMETEEGIDSPEMDNHVISQSEVFANVDPAVVPIMNEVFKQNLDAEAPQVQVAMRYELDSYQLLVSVYEARNLNIEGMSSAWKVYVQATLIPCQVGPFRSEPLMYAISHMFHHVFEIPLEPDSLQGQSLQITLWQVCESGPDDCLGGTQISLSEFRETPYVPSKWYNLLSIEDVEDITEGRRKRKYSLSVRSPSVEVQGISKRKPIRRRTQSVLLKPSYKSSTPSGSPATLGVQRRMSNPSRIEKYLKYRNKYQHGADKANGCEKKEQPSRTSIDLELERETARMKQLHVNADIANLKEMKQRLEEDKARGSTELPGWFTENKRLQSLLAHASDDTMASSEGEPREGLRVELSKQSCEETHMSKILPDRGFRKQMDFFTSAKVDIPPIPPDLS